MRNVTGKSERLSDRLAWLSIAVSVLSVGAHVVYSAKMSGLIRPGVPADLLHLLSVALAVGALALSATASLAQRSLLTTLSLLCAIAAAFKSLGSV
jgi:hypothetical protein